MASGSTVARAKVIFEADTRKLERGAKSAERTVQKTARAMEHDLERAGKGFDASHITREAHKADRALDSVDKSARGLGRGLKAGLMVGIGGAVAGVVVSQLGYGWLNAVAACLLLPLAALALRRAVARPAPDSAKA